MTQSKLLFRETGYTYANRFHALGRYIELLIYRDMKYRDMKYRNMKYRKGLRIQ